MKDSNKNSIELNFIDTTNYISKNKELSNDIKVSLIEDKEENIENKEQNKLYGNDIKIKNPKTIGKMWAFLYYKDYPLIVIGPNCKKIFQLNFYNYS